MPDALSSSYDSPVLTSVQPARADVVINSLSRATQVNTSSRVLTDVEKLQALSRTLSSDEQLALNMYVEDKKRLALGFFNVVGVVAITLLVVFSQGLLVAPLIFAYGILRELAEREVGKHASKHYREKLHAEFLSKSYGGNADQLTSAQHQFASVNASQGQVGGGRQVTQFPAWYTPDTPKVLQRTDTGAKLNIKVAGTDACIWIELDYCEGDEGSNFRNRPTNQDITFDSMTFGLNNNIMFEANDGTRITLKVKMNNPAPPVPPLNTDAAHEHGAANPPQNDASSQHSTSETLVLMGAVPGTVSVDEEGLNS